MKHQAVEIDNDKMIATKEIHCAHCGRFLGYQAILWGKINIKCPNCKNWTKLDISPDKSL